MDTKNKLERIKTLLINRPILGWIFIKRNERKFNLYVAKEIDEDFLYGEKENHYLMIFKNINGKIGESTMSIDFSENDSEISKKIDDAEFSATLVVNEKYVPIEKYEGYVNVKGVDPFFEKKNPNEYFEKLTSIKNDFLDEIKKDPSVKIANLELFFMEVKSEIITNAGVHQTQRRTENMILATILHGASQNEKEFHSSKTECLIDELKPKEFAKKLIETVKNTSHAIKPKKFLGPIILSDDAVIEFFVPSTGENPLVLHSFGRFKHTGISRYKLNEPIANFKKDKLTLISNPHLDFGLRTLRYDAETVPSKVLPIIEKGIFKNHIATKMYADYLKIKPSGPLGNIEVISGNVSEKDFYKNEAYEIVSFSWFDPNPFSGDFSAEIRMGYIIKNGKKTPFRGGMLTGNVFKMIENANYSSERIKSGAYFGPKKAIFYDMNVASEE